MRAVEEKKKTISYSVADFFDNVIHRGKEAGFASGLGADM